jgi:peptidoglycan hydrolase-like protein with peptidoglycan-binding domain
MMNPDTRRKVRYGIVAGAAFLLTAAPAAIAQSGTGGSEPTTGNRPSHARPGTTTDTGTEKMDRGRDATGNHPMGERGAKQGDMSRIRRAQEALKSEGHDPGPVDGKMGPKTQDALRQFQKQENLRETGRLDQETMSKLGV